MTMTKLQTLTPELPIAGRPSPVESAPNIADEAGFLSVLKGFEQGRMSSGKAGRSCGLGRVEFLLKASRVGVPVVDLEGEDLADEFV